MNLVTMPCENWKPISPVQDLGDTAVGDAKLSRDDARSDAGGGHLDDLEPDLVDGDDGQVCDDDDDDDHASDDDHDGYPAYSHHDKIPPWWGIDSNDEGGNVSVSKTHHTP